jgi:hypothetical protein
MGNFFVNVYSLLTTNLQFIYCFGVVWSDKGRLIAFSIIKPIIHKRHRGNYSQIITVLYSELVDIRNKSLVTSNLSSKTKEDAVFLYSNMSF